jgi:imidazolonepropionase-like amidohydrolase
MKRAVTTFFCTAALAAAASIPPQTDSFLIRNATVHTMAGADIANGSVLVRDGKIAGVGQNLSAPAGTQIIDGTGLHVYPGMIDAGTTVGLTEIGAVRESSDVAEIGKFNPQLRASVAVNPSSEHVPVTRANGITSIIALPAGELISGQASLMHLDGWTSDEMTVKGGAALHLRMPTVQTRMSGRFFDDTPPGGGGSSYDEARKKYAAEMHELNDFFESAHRYQKAKSAHLPGFQQDLRFEAMLPVINGEEPVLISAARERAIRDAIAFGEKQKIKIILADAVEAYKVAGELAAKKIPVILGPTLALPEAEDDPYDRPFTTPSDLFKAGVKFAFASNSVEFSRNLPYQAATAVAFGLPHDEALKAITVNAAQIWGVDKLMGSIEEGKWADLMITDGDPLETPTQVKQLFIKGKPVDLDNKHHRLYEKYLKRP